MDLLKEVFTIKGLSYCKKILFCFLVLFIISASVFVYAVPLEGEVGIEGEPIANMANVTQAMDGTGIKAISAAIAIGLAAAVGAIAMGIAISKSSESIARQPEAEGKIRTNLLLGLVFVETTVIYALVVAIMIIFVL